MKKLFISAGEQSGDIFGAALSKAFIEAGWKISGIGGSHLKNAGVNLIENIVSKSTIGFIEPLSNIPFFWKLLSKIKRFTSENRPDAAVVIDFWGFHSRLIKLFAKQHIPVFYYISPQIWASRFGRIRKIKRYVKKVFPVLPFEEKLYLDYGVDAFFAGHPLTSIVPEPSYNPDSPFIGFLPGSRKGELVNHLPVMIQIAAALKKQGQFRFKCFRPPSLSEDLYASIPGDWELVEDGDYFHRKSLRLAISSSGTATLENALLGIPMIIMYKTSSLSFAIAKQLVKINFIGMPNILSQKLVSPEFVQKEAVAERILPTLHNLLKKEQLTAQSDTLLKIRKTLTRRGIEKTVVRQVEENIL